MARRNEPSIGANVARGAYTVTPSDSVDLPLPAKRLYIGKAGDIAVVPYLSSQRGESVSVMFKNHPVGYLECQVSRVMQTGLGADNIVALYD